MTENVSIRLNAWESGDVKAAHVAVEIPDYLADQQEWF